MKTNYSFLTITNTKMIPIDALLGALVGVSAAAGALVMKLGESLGRFLCGIRVTYEPI